MRSSELEHRSAKPPGRLGRAVAVWVGAAVATVAGGVVLALWGLGLTSRLSSSTSNILDIVKLAFAFVAGVGGTLGLVLAYRRHVLAEEGAVREAAKESREDTKLFNERFEKAAGQLGSEQYAVKLAGVYAMAGLADDWAAGRQTCIDVLCANLRRRYSAEPDLEQAPDEYQLWRDNREFRHTIIQAITTRLRVLESPWQGLVFDFRGAVFDGGSFTNARFGGGTVDFTGVTFSGGTVDFTGVTFSGGEVSFSNATFSSGTVDFNHATFSGGEVSFSNATFSGGAVDFNHATFSGSTVYFYNATFSDSMVDFGGATFSRGAVFVTDARFAGGTVDFRGATLSGGTVYFNGATFSGGEVSFNYATFSGSTVYFTGATFSGGELGFDSATFSGGELGFDNATFSGSEVDFTRPQDWSAPPRFPFPVDAPPPGVVLPGP